MRGAGRGAPGGRLLLAALLLLLLPLPPARAWYKHVASPRLHTVGRAAGLLMGLRRSPYVWRRALQPAAAPNRPDPATPFPLTPAARELWRALRSDPRLGRPVGPRRSSAELARAFGGPAELPWSSAWVGPRVAPPWS
ncbi:neuropeptide W [Erinaceus europaeus]|uniref:Neuropeptide W n=1 Tax=Erinaceus europaeus TaxID=9365 RepID=A0ABM3VVA7_ERIEU|nr:neuropeptide W [Erinaceus europaeus]